MTKAVIRLATAALAFGAPAFAQTVFATDGLGEFHGGGVGDRIVTFDISNPLAVTELGHTGIAGTLMSGIEFGPGGVLYCYARSAAGGTGELYTVNQTTGAATIVGSGGVLPGDRINDLAWSPTDGKMYGVGELRGATVTLYEIDLGTGIAAVNSSITDPSGTMLNVGLAVDPTTNDIYVHDLVLDQIYVRVGGAFVALPNGTGFDANFNQGMGHDPASGTLYMGTWNQAPFRAELRSVDVTTGITTFIGFIGPFNAGTGLGEYNIGDIAIAADASCGKVYCDTNARNCADISISSCDCSDGSSMVCMSNACVPDGNFTYLLIGANSMVVTDPPGSNGDLCVVGGCIGRYIADAGAIAGGSFCTDIFNNLTVGGDNIPNCGGSLCNPPGQTWNFQYWHRDGMNPSRFSKALTATFN